MTDIHTHILPGVDDGAPDQECTLAMLAIARADGILGIAATPHANSQYPFDPDRCRREIDRLNGESVGGPEIYSGCEVHLVPENVDAVVRNPADFTLNGADCVLTELPDSVPASSAETALQVLLDFGLRPIIAHPERNLLFQHDSELADRLAANGVYLQLTAGAISGSFGVAARATAWRLLRSGVVHMVATDAHGRERRRPVLSRAHGEVVRHFGAATAELLFTANPRNAVMGRRIDRVRPRRSLFAMFTSNG